MDARLLTGMEDQRFRERPDLSPQAQLTDPNSSLQVQPGPVGALAMSGPQAGPSSAANIAQPAGQPAGDPNWTPERRAFVKSVHDTATRYKQAVEGRRAQRKALSEYGKLKHQLDTAAGTLSDLTGMEKDYPDIYGPDSPATMALQRHKVAHFEKAHRLRQELNHRAQQLQKQFGFKVGKNGGLADEDTLAEAGDQQFDDWMKEGYMDALMSQPPQ